MNTHPSTLIDKKDSTDMSYDMKCEYDRKENNELNLNTPDSSSPDLNLYLSSSEQSNKSDDDIEIIGEYIVNSGRGISHKTKRTRPNVDLKKPANHYTAVAANTNSQLSYSSNTQTEQNTNILKESSLEEERNTSKHSSETICFCSNFNEKIKNLIMKTTSLQTQLNRMCSSDYNNTQQSSHINSEKDLMTLQEALNSLSFALKITMRQAKLQKNLNRNTKFNAIKVTPTFKSPLNLNEDRITEQECSRASFKNRNDISPFSMSLTKVGDEFTTKNKNKEEKEPDQIIKSSKKVLIKGPDGERKYCLCENGTLPVTKDMIGCDFCEMWYHPSCIGLKKDDIDKIIKTRWMCPLCDQLCDGMFVKQPDLKSTPNKRKLKLPNTEINDPSDLDQNRNSSTFTEQSPKRKKMGPNLEMLEIEQSFNLSTVRKSSKLSKKLLKKSMKKLKEFNQTDDDDQDYNEITSKSNQCVNDCVRTKHKNMSKPDKWIVRKKYLSLPEKSRIYETNSSFGLMNGGICRKSDSRKTHICKEKWYKKKVKNKDSKQNFKGEFIYKQTLLINDTKSS